ncbi:MAG: Prolyl oligopeptidase family [Actinomycetota bacterium]|nr:Prolyl oligopeptidase family [Actinomycetota bacterium]
MTGSEFEVRTPGVRPISRRDVAGVEREYLVCVPDGPLESIGVMFHPFGSTPEMVVYGEEPGEYLITHLEGVLRPANAVGMLVIAPRARGRAVDGVSMGWKPHLDAAWELATTIRDQTDAMRIVAGGLSMGGLEALVFGGQHADEIAAVWAVNPVIDVAEWFAANPDELFLAEVGGLPSDAAEQYRVRSADSYAAELARTRVRLTWSPDDTVIPNQATKHAHPLADAIRALGGDLMECIVTQVPADPMLDAGRVAHESCDVWENIGWAANWGHR